jgi:hypothetical protein
MKLWFIGERLWDTIDDDLTRMKRMIELSLKF